MDFKEIAGYLNLNADEIKTLDDFKAKFDGEFIRRANVKNDEKIVSAIVGQRIGSIETAVRRLAKENGVEIGDDYKDKKVEEIIGFVEGTIKTNHTNKLAELENQLKGSSDDRIKAWEQKYSKLETRFSETNDLLTGVKTQLETVQKDSDNRLKEYKIGDSHKSALNTLKFKNGITDVERIGFETLIKSKYVLDLDEEGNALILDAKSKKQIPNTNKAGTFMSPSEIYDMELASAGLKQQNNAGGGGAGAGSFRFGGNNEKNDGPVNDNPRRKTYDQR